MAEDSSSVKFLFDENLVRLGLAVRTLRTDTTYMGADDVQAQFPLGFLDRSWIPIAAALGWVVVTNDKSIRTRPVEAALGLAHGLKVVHIHKAGHLNTWSQAVRLISRWHAIDAQIAAHPSGPWWLSMRKATTTAMEFRPGEIER